MINWEKDHAQLSIASMQLGSCCLSLERYKHLTDLYLNINSKQLQFNHNCSSTRKLKSRMIDFCLSFCLLFAYYHFLQHRSVCSNHPLLKPLPLQAFQTLVSSNGHILFLWVWIDLYQQ